MPAAAGGRTVRERAAPELVAWLPEDVVQRMHPSIELILSFSFFYKLKAFHVVALYQNVDVHVQIVYDYGCTVLPFTRSDGRI